MLALHIFQEIFFPELPTTDPCLCSSPNISLKRTAIRFNKVPAPVNPNPIKPSPWARHEVAMAKLLVEVEASYKSRIKFNRAANLREWGSSRR